MTAQNLLVLTPTIPSKTGGTAILKLNNPPTIEITCACRTLLADSSRIMYVFHGMPPSV